MKTRVLLVVLTALGATTMASKSYATDSEPIRYSGSISGFALSTPAQKFGDVFCSGSRSFGAHGELVEE